IADAVLPFGFQASGFHFLGSYPLQGQLPGTNLLYFVFLSFPFMSNTVCTAVQESCATVIMNIYLQQKSVNS
ncbi:hypothetical protein, partial [Treponema porcinum]|uniref:hypothetical protein n=1 Tax=Treponema porcinum TaxID=261392 RepID=UPI002357CA94